MSTPGTDLAAVWAALVAAQDYMVVPDGFEAEDDPVALVARAKLIVESEMRLTPGAGFIEAG